MIYKAKIENFWSIFDLQEIDLRSRRSVEDILGRLSPIHQGSGWRCPGVVALYGANAAGKSNVLRAICFGAWFVTQSFAQQVNQPLPYQKFNSVTKAADPTRLSFTFSGPVDFLDTSGGGLQCPYSYELVLSPRPSEDFVILEKLSYQPRGSGKPTTIIERREGSELRFVRGLMNANHERALKAVLRQNASVFCTLAALNHEAAKNFVGLVSQITSNILFDRFESDDGQISRWYESNPSAFNQLKDIGKRIDLGIENIEFDHSPDIPQLTFQHAGLDLHVPYQAESHGTRQFVKLFPNLRYALDCGGIAVVDDIDSAIHPLLLPEICRWFTDGGSNPHGAQLWMTCHSPSLMNELTKEGILLCEKNPQGRTSVYGLADVEGVRRNENFYGNYMSGEYGAIPSIG